MLNEMKIEKRRGKANMHALFKSCSGNRKIPMASDCSFQDLDNIVKMSFKNDFQLVRTFSGNVEVIHHQIMSFHLFVFL